MIRCVRCKGKMFLDRMFTDNKNFEMSCIQCGDHKFIPKNTELGRWLTKNEALRENAASR